MKKYSLFLVTLVLSTAHFSQAKEIEPLPKVSVSSISARYSALFRVTRITPVPENVVQSDFYQQYFGDFGKPDRDVRHKFGSNQILLNTGFAFNRLKEKMNHELQVGFGYQQIESYQDRITRRDYFLNQPSVDVARISINHDFNLWTVNASWFFKTNWKTFNLYAGVGTNIGFSNTQQTVTEFELGEKTNQYEIDKELNFAYQLYIPLGFEAQILNAKGKGFIYGLDYSIRLDREMFSGISLFIGAKF